MLNQLLVIPILLAQASTPQFGTDADFFSDQTFSFSSFDGIAEPGQIDIGSDRTVSWEAGTRPEDLITLGDIQQLGAQDLTLDQIFKGSVANIEDYTLGDFPLLANSTLEDAAKATGNNQDFLDNVLLDGDTIGEAIEAGNGGDILGEQIDTETPLSEIEAVQDTVIGQLEEWESEAIGSIPGLSALPFAKYPAQLANNALAAISLFAEADLILDEAEKGIDNTITGSIQSGFKFATPCPRAKQQVCGHVELGRSFPIPKAMRGKRWINGKHQKVRGGTGALGAVFEYKEPTGRLALGPDSPFKLVLTETNEIEDKASFSAYFQYCEFLLGCTGYNIGPFPLYSVTIRPGKPGTIWMGVDPEQAANIPVGFDPAVVSSPEDPTGASNGSGYSSPNPFGPKGDGKPNQCNGKQGKNGSVNYIWPASGPITSGFSPSRVNPVTGAVRPHLGIDIGAPTGAPAVAIQGAVVLKTGWNGGFGNTVEIREACTGHEFLYAHLSKINVKPGQELKQGQQLGEIGSTGLSTGPHLHFEFYKNGRQTTNPRVILP